MTLYGTNHDDTNNISIKTMRETHEIYMKVKQQDNHQTIIAGLIVSVVVGGFIVSRSINTATWKLAAIAHTQLAAGPAAYCCTLNPRSTTIISDAHHATLILNLHSAGSDALAIARRQ